MLYTYDDNAHLLAETDATGPIRSYVWRDDTPVAQIEHRPTRKVLYLETDHLNTPRAARNETGVLVWRWEADAFGSSLPDEDPDGDGQPTVINLRYPGQIFDPESGLHYNQARYYDPTSGRYLSPDPIGLAGGVNTYAYVGSNPLAFVDPMGLAACFVDFPDYPITIPGTKVQTTLTPGHAGVFGYDESTGQTRYYEYGRYASDFGSVERRRLPNLEIQPDGTPTPESWKKLIDALNKIGKDTDAELSCDKSADETKVYEYSERVKNDTNRPPYSWNPFRSNTCRDFARRAFEAGGGN
nr:D473 [uncultured bacterium]